MSSTAYGLAKQWQAPNLAVSTAMAMLAKRVSIQTRMASHRVHIAVREPRMGLACVNLQTIQSAN